MACPQCTENDTLFMFVEITVSCPAGQLRLDKTAIRSKNIEIITANWDKARYYCKNCGYSFNFERETK